MTIGIGGGFKVDIILEFILTEEFHGSTRNISAADEFGNGTGQSGIARDLHGNDRSGVARFAFIINGGNVDVMTRIDVVRKVGEEVLLFSDKFTVHLHIVVINVVTHERTVLCDALAIILVDDDLVLEVSHST